MPVRFPNSPLKTAIYRVNEKIQTAHLRNTPRALDFFRFLASYLF
jgi:hypothetical protein